MTQAEINEFYRKGELKLPQDFKEWDSLPDRTYKFIITQAKENFEECLSESESITDKSIKFVIAIFGFFGAFIAAIICSRVPGWLIILCIIFFATDLYYWTKLIFPKDIIPRGSKPFDLFNKEFDNPEFTETDKIRLVYFNECVRYEDRITNMNTLNQIRISKYKKAIWLFLCSLVLILVVYLVFVFHL
jgi:hypothetical protein